MQRERQAAPPVRDERRHVRHLALIHGQPQVREPGEQGRKGGQRLLAGERSPDAAVHADAEGQVLGGVPGRVEPVGVLAVLVGVVPGRHVAGDDRVARLDRDAADLDRLDGEAQRQVGDRRRPAQRLLDHRVPGDLPSQHPPEVVGMGEQGVHGVADQVDRGLVPGRDQQQQGVAQLGLAERVAAVTDVDQLGGQVVALVLALVGDQRGQHRGDLRGRGLRLLRGGGGVHDGLHDLGHLLPHVRGNAEQLADHPHRQRVGVEGAQVDGLTGRLRGHRVQQLGDDLLDDRLHGLAATRGEAGCDQLAQPAVLVAVRAQHVGHADPGEDPGPARRDERLVQLAPVPLVLAHPWIEDELLEQVVPGDRPGGDASGELYEDQGAEVA